MVKTLRKSVLVIFISVLCLCIAGFAVNYVSKTRTVNADPEVTVLDATDISSVTSPGSIDQFTFFDWATLGATTDGNQYVYSWGAVGTTYVAAKFNLKLGANSSWLFIAFGATVPTNACIGSGQSAAMFYIGSDSHCGTFANTSDGFSATCAGYDFSAGGEYLIEVGVKEAGHYYLKINDVVIQDVSGLASGVGSYLNITTWDANTQIKSTQNVVDVKDVEDILGVEWAEKSGEATLGDLGASTYTGFNFDITLPTNSDFEIKMTFFCAGGVWERAMMLHFTNGQVRFSYGDASWYTSGANNYQPYTSSLLNAGSKVNLEFGTLGVHTDGPYYYYFKFNGVLAFAPFTETVPTGTKIAYYTNSVFTLGNKPAIVEKKIEDYIDDDYINYSEPLLYDLNETTWVSFKTRIYIPSSDFSIRFILNSDGETPANNNSGMGGTYEFRLNVAQNKVYATFPSANHFYVNGEYVNADLIKEGATLLLEIGIEGQYTYFFKINGSEVLRRTDSTSSGTDWYSGYGSKFYIEASQTCLLEKTTATCVHEAVWTTPDPVTRLSILSCEHCNVCLGSKYVVDEKAIEDFVDVDGFMYNEPVFVDLARETYVSLKFRVFIVPADDFRIRIIMATDGDTMVSNGSGTVSGMGEYIITNEKIVLTYPEASHFFESESVSVGSITSGATLLIEVGVKSRVGVDGAYEFFIKVNGTTYIDKFDSAYDTYYAGEGTMCAIYSDTPVYIEKSTATCDHVAVVCDEYTADCVHTTLKCSECGAILVGEVEHDFGTLIAATPATCENDGVVAHYTCSRCGKHFDKNHVELTSLVDPATGHTYVWHNVVESDCSNHGTPGHYVCSVCGKFFNDNKEEISNPTGTLPTTEHHMTHINGVEADCENTGTKEHYHCSICNKNFEDEAGTVAIADVVIPKTEHTFGEWIPEVPATTEKEGVKGHYHCSVCDKDFDENYEEIDSLVIAKLSQDDDGCNLSMSTDSYFIFVVSAISVATLFTFLRKKRRNDR